MKRGEHYAACPSAFGDDDECRGCVPREAVGDSLICGRCYQRLRGLIAATPEMLAHLRSMTDPLKAAVYDREPGGGVKVHAPPPVPVELLDAPDFMVTVLWSTREVVEGRMPFGRMQVPVRAGTSVLFDFASEMVEAILAGLSDLSKRGRDRATRGCGARPSGVERRVDAADDLRALVASGRSVVGRTAVPGAVVRPPGNQGDTSGASGGFNGVPLREVRLGSTG